MQHIIPTRVIYIMTNNEKADEIQISNDLNQIENENNVKFDFSELQTLRADGVLVYCNGKNICLLFYHHMKPYVSNNGSKKQKQINKCLIEIQMEPEHLNIVSGVIQAAIQTYQSKTEETGNNPGEEKNPNTSMFV